MRLLALAALLLSTGANAEEGRFAWSVVSDNVAATGEQVAQGSGCRFTVKKEGQLLWTAERCLADREDFRFLSNDGRSLLVLFSFPSKGAGMKRAAAGELWRMGKKVASWPVGRFVKDERPLVNASRHFYWLEGAMGQPGVPPGIADGGRSVELSTLDRRNFRIGFDGTIKLIPPPDPLNSKKH